MSASFERSPATCTLLIFPLLIFCCVAPLGCYHSCLVCSNRTTAEDVKGTLKPKNPFSRGCRSRHRTAPNCHCKGQTCARSLRRGNCHEVLCAARLASRVHPRAVDGADGQAMLAAAVEDGGGSHC